MFGSTGEVMLPCRAPSRATRRRQAVDGRGGAALLIAPLVAQDRFIITYTGCQGNFKFEEKGSQVTGRTNGTN